MRSKTFVAASLASACVASIPAVAWSDSVTYAIDPSQSLLTVTGNLTGNIATAQTSGSLTTSFSGTIAADRGASTIQFFGGSAMDAALQSVKQQPRPDATPGSAPADYGRTAPGPFFSTTLEALRDFVLDVESNIAIPVSGTTFDSTELVLLVDSGESDWTYGSVFGEHEFTGAGTANGAGTHSTIVTGGGTETLTLFFNTGPIGYSINQTADSSLRFNGQIVATRQIAPASTWAVDSNGDWSNALNWTGGVPNAVGAVANFGGVITAEHTVTNDVPHTVGTINFDNANRYTIAGPATLTIDGTSITVVNGSHTILAPLQLNDSVDIDVVTASDTLTISQQMSAAAGVSIAKNGAGTLAVKNVRADGMTINAGTVAIAPDGTASGTSRVDTLTIAAAAKLDLSDNKLIVTTVGSTGSWNGSAYTDITGLVQSGRNGGGWGGSGIVTSQSSATTGNFTSIGIATAQQVKGLANPSETAIFAGQTVTGTDTVVMYTYGGDANLDGKINVDDYGHIDSSIPIGLAGWFNGDFNYDGKINVDDYGIIDFNIGIQGAPFFTGTGAQGPTLAAVPEPAAVGSLGIVGACVLLKRRRGHKSAEGAIAQLSIAAGGRGDHAAAR